MDAFSTIFSLLSKDDFVVSTPSPQESSSTTEETVDIVDFERAGSNVAGFCVVS